MKPWHQSKKLWTAVVGGLLNVLAVVVTQYVKRPELATVLVASLTTISGALVVAIGLADQGKESASLWIDDPDAEE